MEDEDLFRVNRPPQVEGKSVHLRHRLEIQFLEHVSHGQVRMDTINHQTHGSLWGVFAEIGHSLMKVRICQAGHGNEELPLKRFRIWLCMTH
jgi:hypothetical protein